MDARQSVPMTNNGLAMTLSFCLSFCRIVVKGYTGLRVFGRHGWLLLRTTGCMYGLFALLALKN